MKSSGRILVAFIFTAIFLSFTASEFLTRENSGTVTAGKIFSIEADSSATVEISMKDEEFVPQEKTVSAGTTVKWINKENEKHNVASGTPDNPDKLFHSKRMSKGDEFTHKFDKPGTYPYFCTYHEDMVGKIIVK
jgi:plastocyanin